MPTDIQIAQDATLLPIETFSAMLNVPDSALYHYGPYMAKLNPQALPDSAEGRVVLVTAINPTPAGEGKTTVSIGLADALTLLGERSCLALREPSMGPVFGMKGGAAGGGYAQVLPMEEINLHFTGDMHAITSANNLLCALIDNHILRHAEPKIDRVRFRRCLDVNDRQLRYVIDGLNGPVNGRAREDGFDITPASEIMATFCLANDLDDLRLRLARIIVGDDEAGHPITVGDLQVEGSLLVLLRQALQPNLVQSLGGTPALLHGGPFANIAHGCNSVIATKTAQRVSDWVITEAGFGADLGAEKFLDIKCRQSGIRPSCVVVVATVRALKSHGGVPQAELNQTNLAAVSRGMENLLHHIQTLQDVFHLQPIVAINHFVSDHPDEVALIQDAVQKAGSQAYVCKVWAEGGAGAIELAEAVRSVGLQANPDDLRFAYPLDLPYIDKAEMLAQRVYGAAGVSFHPAVQKRLQEFDSIFPGLPICVAKTQYSLSDEPKKVGAPRGFTLHVRDARISAGAGFVVLYTGDIITMPGLPVHPAALDIDINKNGQTIGMF